MKKDANNIIRRHEQLIKIGDRREHLGRVARTAWEGGRIGYMSWEQLPEEIKERYRIIADEVIKASRKPIRKRTGIERLMDAGIITKDGKLAPQYKRGKNVRDS